MSTQDRGLVAITGANGTIGYATTLYALKEGYRVRCVVRTQDAIATIKAGPSLQQFSDSVEYAIVPGNTIPGAYDEALRGAKYAIHIAGVWPKPDYHPDNDIWYPFINSMENILSAAEASNTIKRIIFTQAGASFVNPDDGFVGNDMHSVINEHTPVNASVSALRPPLKSPHHAYCAAKAHCMSHLSSLASRSPPLPFSIVQVIPGTVIGPSELRTTSNQARASMDRMSQALLFNASRAVYCFGFVHNEDCARVHVNALDEIKVPDKDIPDWFIAAGTGEVGKGIGQLWGEVGEMLEREFGKEVEKGLFSVGKENWPINMPFRVENERTRGMLLGGGTFRGLGENVREVAEWYGELVRKETVGK